jgi:hypothetical protein
LGVAVQDLTPDLAEALGLDADAGALVSSVVPASPAAEAGIEAEDLIVALDGEAVADADDLARRIRAQEPGHEIRVDLRRGTGSHTLQIELGRRAALAPLHALPRGRPQLPEWRRLPERILPRIRPRLRHRYRVVPPETREPREALVEEMARLRLQIEELREQLEDLRKRLGDE